MADYCAIGDVNDLVPQQPFTPDSVPTDAQVSQFITDITQELDATLKGLGYSVPVTVGDIALNQLKRACAWGALGIAQDARMTAVYRDDSQGGQKNVWTQRYEGFKQSLQDPKNPYELHDAPRTDTQVVKPTGALHSSTVDQPDRSTYLDTPPFYIGMKF